MSSRPDKDAGQTSLCKPGVGALVLLLAGMQSAAAAGPEAPAAVIRIAARSIEAEPAAFALGRPCLLYTSDAADE